MPRILDKLFKEDAAQAIRGSYLGIDIGTSSIKAVEILMSSGKPSIVNYGMIESSDYLERVNGVLQTSSLSIAGSDAPRMLKMLVARMGVKTREVVATIPSFSAFTSLIDMPAMSDVETAQAVPYQARSLVPLPISDVSIDWTLIGQFEDQAGIKKQRVFLISVPNEQINAHRAVFKKAGLNLKMLEVEGISLARMLAHEVQEDILILDIGAFTSTIAIAGQGVLKYSAQTDFAGNALTQALAKGLGISVKRAEILKKQKGLSGMTGEYGLSTLMTPFIDVILNEVRKSKDIFERGGGRISRLVLAGGGGSMQGLAAYVEKQIGIPTQEVGPWSAVSYPSQFAPLFRSVASRFSIAAGVGIKSLIE